ncbi:hypothetical protein Y1Q_0008072 [Alligator mississippiensis]|uniref:Uncharacterized protein n=1 Tax=Alligator mississippiensis TaxID=8496 RepID=A0A151NFD6_ALLMI|nr:hypothetical protein Y1Q_0008072 [Alligator mississippiensis]
MQGVVVEGRLNNSCSGIQHELLYIVGSHLQRRLYPNSCVRRSEGKARSEEHPDQSRQKNPPFFGKPSVGFLAACPGSLGIHHSKITKGPPAEARDPNGYYDGNPLETYESTLLLQSNFITESPSQRYPQ